MFAETKFGRFFCLVKNNKPLPTEPRLAVCLKQRTNPTKIEPWSQLDHQNHWNQLPDQTHVCIPDPSVAVSEVKNIILLHRRAHVFATADACITMQIFNGALITNSWGLQHTQRSPSNDHFTQKCSLSWPTNSALVYEPKCGEWGSCGCLSQWVVHRSQNNKLPNQEAPNYEVPNQKVTK
jgi:hypothetical protein